MSDRLPLEHRVAVYFTSKMEEIMANLSYRSEKRVFTLSSMNAFGWRPRRFRPAVLLPLRDGWNQHPVLSDWLDAIRRLATTDREILHEWGLHKAAGAFRLASAAGSIRPGHPSATRI